MRETARGQHHPAPGPYGDLPPRRSGRPVSAPPPDLEPAVSARAMDNMMGWLRFSEWM
ncbi:hypothetical protein ACFW6V_06465 [Streptomyces sp. NPDC058734]|uniref:hypothetical protein n=1 Tax=Streptomyces sp. NPDC058734 TaxID=3346615 RepID=UPI0036C9594B